LGRQSGITLIEVVAVLAVIALTVSVATPMLSGVTMAGLKSGAGSVSGAIRFMFNHVSMNGAYCRIRFELQGGEYAGECSDKPIYLSKRLETAGTDGERVEEEDEVGRFGMDEEQKAERERNKAAFAEIRPALLKKSKLQDGIRFDGIWTGHQRERFTKGQGYLYFFPGGYAERAYIYLADEKGNIYTIVVAPLTGKTAVYPEYLEAPEK
jgi:general secretion pathway protein H